MKSVLGKGLSALISEDAVADVSSTQTAKPQPSAATSLSIDLIRANPKQPRRTFAEEPLADLVASIQEKGILQPLVVSPTENGFYEIIAGERRFRAAQRAGLKEVPVVVRQGSEAEKFELALIENLQREDLNAIDLAEGFLRLQDEFQMTQEQIAKVVGKARSVVANTLRLLGLSEEIKLAIKEGKLSSGHAKALLSVEDPAAQKALFDQILSDGLTVRVVENAAREHKGGVKREHLRVNGYDQRPPEVRAQEEALQSTLARKVEIHTSSPSSHKGWIKLEFYSLDDFDAIVHKLKN